MAWGLSSTGLDQPEENSILTRFLCVPVFTILWLSCSEHAQIVLQLILCLKLYMVQVYAVDEQLSARES